MTVVLALALGAAALRVEGTARDVFAAGGVRLQGTDPWYHARLAFGLSRHPLAPIRFDPYTAFPDGQWVPFAPLPDALTAAGAWALARGRPEEWTVDAVAAALPVAFAAGCVVAAAAVAGSAFGPGAGAAAAALLAFAPGPFLEMTRLGWADHHAEEAFFALLVLLGLCRSLGRLAEVRAAAPADLWPGLALALYLLSWGGGAFLVLSLLAWVVLQAGLDRWQGRAPLPAPRVVAPALVALVAVALFQPWSARAAVQLGALGLWLAAGAAASTAGSRASRRVARLLGLLAGAATIALLAADLPGRLWHEITRLPGTDVMGTVAEAQPLFIARGHRSLTPIWERHGLALLLLPVSLTRLGRRVLREGDRRETLLFVWATTALVTTLFQNRFGYYLSGAAAIVNAALVAELIRRAASSAGVLRRAAWSGLAAALLVALVGADLHLSRRAVRVDRAPSGDWVAALDWLRGHTPEPFGDPELYARDAAPARGETWSAPAGSYGILAWWDYGHWITKIARRAPVANPMGLGASRAAAFLLAQSEAEAAPYAERVRYAIVDSELPLMLVPDAGLKLGKFPAVATWGQRPVEEYVQTAFHRTEDGSLRAILLFEPRYYRTLMARLYLFGGRAVEPARSSWVVRTESRTGSDGTPWEELVEAEPFPDYASALQASESRPGTRLVGLEPAQSCVPLEALEGYRLVYESPQPGLFAPIAAVRVFELAAGAAPTRGF